jgi:hypothetical protein
MPGTHVGDLEGSRDTHPRKEKKKKEGHWFSVTSIIVGLVLGYVAALISFMYALME